MTETLQALSFDPAGVAPEGRNELSLTSYIDGIEVAAKGLDYGSTEVKQFLAEGEFGSRPIDHIWPLRVIKIPLLIGPTKTLSFDAVRSRLEAKVSEVNESGAVLKRTLPSGRVIYADVLEAKLSLSASWLAENRERDLGATLELQASPDLYGEEVVGEAHEGTGDLSFTQVIQGTLPARVTGMQVEDRSGNNQLGLMWHFRRRHYSSATTAAWAYDAEALGTLDIAEKVTLAGSYGTKVVKHPKLSSEWTPVLSTNMAGTTFLTHTGLYDVWARVYAEPQTVAGVVQPLPWLRLLYGAGDVVAPQPLQVMQVPGPNAWYLVNLGQINIPALPFGAQRWEGVVQARTEGTGTAEPIWIDRLWFLCGDECSGVLGARRSTTALASIVASDSLLTHNAEGKAETLNLTEDTRGHKWEESGGAGAFARELAGTVRKTEKETEGRTAILAGLTVGAVKVKVGISLDLSVSGSGLLQQGVYLRYVDPTHWARVAFQYWEKASTVLQYDIGSGVQQQNFGVSPYYRERHLYGVVPSTMMVEITSDAQVSVTLPEGTFWQHLPTVFKKGEVYGEGKIGIFDYNPSSYEATRTFKEFIASPPPPPDAVMYADKSAYLSTKGMFRQSEDGLGAGPVGYPGADLPRLPVSGTEEAPVEIAVKPSRGQFGEFADSGIDKFKVQVTYRPCWAEIPSS